MARRRKVIMSQLIDRRQDDGAFDAAFWEKVGPKGRMLAMWDMVRTYFAIRGIDEPPARLSRSVARLKRRESAL